MFGAYGTLVGGWSLAVAIVALEKLAAVVAAAAQAAEPAAALKSSQQQDIR